MLKTHTDNIPKILTESQTSDITTLGLKKNEGENPDEKEPKLELWSVLTSNSRRCGQEQRCSRSTRDEKRRCTPRCAPREMKQMAIDQRSRAPGRREEVEEVTEKLKYK